MDDPIIRTLSKIRDEVMMFIHATHPSKGFEKTKEGIYRMLCARVGEHILDEFVLSSTKFNYKVGLSKNKTYMPFSFLAPFSSVYNHQEISKTIIGPITDIYVPELVAVEERTIIKPTSVVSDLEKDYDRAMKFII